MTKPVESEQETWMASLGAKFIDVRMWTKLGEVTERHVNDLTTLPETVRLAMERTKARAAVYPYMGRWALARPRPGKTLRYYDTQEAAEMVAIHSG